jgi:hypothetical protein
MASLKVSAKEANIPAVEGSVFTRVESYTTTEADETAATTPVPADVDTDVSADASADASALCADADVPSAPSVPSAEVDTDVSADASAPSFDTPPAVAEEEALVEA